jgi:putative membrane protein
MRRWNALVALALACGMLAVPSLAGATTTGPDDCWGDSGHHGDCAISAADFLTLAAQSNRFEIETGQLAQQRAESTTVRDLGAMFAQEHTALLGQITDLAVTLGVTLPEGLGPRYQALADQLGTLSGAAFDRAWLKVQWRVHQEALLLLLRGAICADAPEVQALAQGALPAITRHLAELRATILAFPGGFGHHHGDDDHGGDNGKHRGHFQGRGHSHHGRGHGYGHTHHQHA